MNYIPYRRLSMRAIENVTTENPKSNENKKQTTNQRIKQLTALTTVRMTLARNENEIEIFCRNQKQTEMQSLHSNIQNEK